MESYRVKPIYFHKTLRLVSGVPCTSIKGMRVCVVLRTPEFPPGTLALEQGQYGGDALELAQDHTNTHLL